MKSRIASVFTVLATLVVATAVMLAVTASSLEGRAGHARGLAEEELEQQLATRLRLEALRGTGRGHVRTARADRSHTRDWVVGEQVMNPGTDDWEPAIAADPHAPWVYMLVTRYGARPSPGCASPFIGVRRSWNGGAIWSGGKALCPCAGRGQFGCRSPDPCHPSRHQELH